MKCKCCKKEIRESMGSQKYCIPCSLYIRELKKQISYWKGTTKKLRKLHYGLENGTERLK